MDQLRSVGDIDQLVDTYNDVKGFQVQTTRKD